MSSQKGYIYAEVTVNDSATFYDEYFPRVSVLLEQYGAKFIIVDEKPEVIEGGRDVKRVVLFEFESPEKAREFYFSQDYQDGVIKYRLDSTSTHLYFLDGIES